MDHHHAAAPGRPAGTPARLAALRSAALVACLAAHASALAKPPTIGLDCGRSPGFATRAERQYLSKESGGGDIYQVQLTYVGKRPDGKVADAGLRDCLAKASKLDGSKDILATAWLKARASASDNDDEMVNPYPALSYISYSASARSVGIHKLELRRK